MVRDFPKDSIKESETHWPPTIDDRPFHCPTSGRIYLWLLHDWPLHSEFYKEKTKTISFLLWKEIFQEMQRNYNDKKNTDEKHLHVWLFDYLAAHYGGSQWNGNESGENKWADCTRWPMSTCRRSQIWFPIPTKRNKFLLFSSLATSCTLGFWSTTSQQVDAYQPKWVCPVPD